MEVAEKPGFEPGRDLRPARLANECLRPLGHFSGKWGEPPDSNRHRPGSRPGALPIKLGTPLFGGGWRDRTPTPFRASRFSRPISTPALRASEIGGPRPIRTVDLAIIGRVLCLLSYRSVGIRTGFEPAITRLKASWLNHSPTGSESWRRGPGSNRHPLDRQSRTLPVELPRRKMND